MLKIFPLTMSYLIIELVQGGVCRTAPATPVLLNIGTPVTVHNGLEYVVVNRSGVSGAVLQTSNHQIFLSARSSVFSSGARSLEKQTYVAKFLVSGHF